MKTLLAIALAGATLSGAALADTVTIASDGGFPNQDALVTSQSTLHFKGPETIVFSFAGKTCTLNGSARGSVPMGCNYKVHLSTNGSFSGELVAGNDVCTQTPAVTSQCVPVSN